MSVVVAVKADNCVVMAADSLMTWGNTKVPGNQKLIRSGPLVIGCVGSAPVQDFYQVMAAPEVPIPNLADYCRRVLVPALRTYMRDSVLLETRNGETVIPGTALVARGHEFVWIDGGGGVGGGEVGEYWAIGGGSDFALGALHVIKSGRSCRRYIGKANADASAAVAAAIAYSDGCGGPVQVEYTMPYSMETNRHDGLFKRMNVVGGSASTLDWPDGTECPAEVCSRCGK